MAEEYRVGGTCVIRGCVPKKLLVYGAHFAEDLQGRAPLRLGRARLRVRLDGAARQCAGRGRPARRASTRRRSTTTASTIIPRTRDRRRPARSHAWPAARNVTAKYILVATGARSAGARCARAPSLASPRTRSSTSKRCPSACVIAGGGYIANEFAGIFNEFGCSVTLVNRARPDPARL